MTLNQPGPCLAISINDDYGAGDSFSAGAERQCGLFDLIPARERGQVRLLPHFTAEENEARNSWAFRPRSQK